MRRFAALATLVLLAAPATPSAVRADGPALVAVWGSRGSYDPLLFSHPDDATVGPDGLVYVADHANRRVAVFTPQDVFVRQYGSIVSDTLRSPSKVAFGSDGTLYVSDGVACGISMWRDGEYLGWFGGCGSTPGKWIYSFGVATHGGRVYVSDSYHGRIEVFDAQGGFLFDWPTGDQCMGLDIDAQGNLYVAEYSGRIDVFDGSGTLLRSLGEPGTGPGQLAAPYDVSLDGLGRVLVADSNNHRIQVFTTTGAYVTEWGGYGADPGQFHQPRGVSVGPDGRIYVADTWNDRIEVFEALVTPTRTRSWGSIKADGH